MLPAFSVYPSSREVQLQPCVAPEGSCVRNRANRIYRERKGERFTTSNWLTWLGRLKILRSVDGKLEIQESK